MSTPRTPRPPLPGAPRWPHCAHGADPATDAVGCRGIHVPGHTACLAHLTDIDRDAYLAGLSAGDDIDHRGTHFTRSLLNALLDALRDPATGDPRIGVARFDSATFKNVAKFDSTTFTGLADFNRTIFEDSAWFYSVTFEGGAWFNSASFHGAAGFRRATFGDDSGFGSATFEGDAQFDSATFERAAGFRSATFKDSAWFHSATFKREARFDSATFKDSVWFDSATFEDVAVFVAAVFKSIAGFDSATFEDPVAFRAATFEENVGFSSTTFKSGVLFAEATFENDAWFDSATFQDEARFDLATFKGNAHFYSATFQGNARFEAAIFQGNARFEAATFEGDVQFVQAVFERADALGPLVCAGRVVLSGAVFNGPVTLSLAARRVECRRTRWSSTAELRLRHAKVDFAHAFFEYPLTIAAEPDRFLLPDGRPVGEQVCAGTPDAAVRLASLRAVDAAHLVLADVDLSGCLFTGTVHLDQLRLEGTCSFAEVPPGLHWRRRRPVRFTRRRTLAEEHHWRARQPAAVPGWNAAVLGAGSAGPAQLAPVYRALRKAFEDGKNEPGAADFYYGEMEMRRHDRTGTSRAERGLLHGYWLLSGYGLRASRAMGWLVAAMLVTILLLMGFGLPGHSPKQAATGTVPPGGGEVTFEIDKEDPQNPVGNRITGDRFEKALNVTLNSVVFRSSGQDLTTAGTYIEMASRLMEPTLLALAALAVRGRIKR
ncbi:pentapeptide repeat-containing protein [Streptomyces sp. NPDC102462]|uniref:pentapeptide repeat-containing protein n=1 Tax=Streptomyces sp. NPDC102462 TaxID=3366178 RepID=UPI0037F19069